MSGIVFALPLGVIIVVIFIVSLFLHFVPIGLWISARAAGVNVGIFNLGYLPNGDHQITTMADSSLQAIKKAVEYLNRKGELFLVVYIGHDEGKKESLLIEEYVASLDHISYNVALFKMMNKLSAPYVIQIEKR